MMGLIAPTLLESEQTMVTHGGRCPYCESRTIPGIGKRAGQWICAPCQLVLDNYGQVLSGPNEPSGPAADAIQEAAQRPAFMVLPPPRRIRRNV